MVIRVYRMLVRLPPRYLNYPAQRARLAELARDLVASIDDRSIGDAVGAIEDSLLRRGRCPPAGRLVDDVTGSGAITQASRLGRNQPLYARVLALGGGVGLQFAQPLVTAGANHRDAMLFLSRQRDPFTVADIDRKSTRLNSSH